MKWVFVILAFVNGVPEQSQVAGGDTQTACEAMRERAKEALKTTKDVQFSFGKCHALVIPAVPKFQKEQDS